MKVVCRKPHRFWYSINTMTADYALVSGSITYPEVGDAILKRDTGANTSQRRSILPSIEYSYIGQEGLGFSFSSSNEAVATVSSLGVVTPVAAGAVTITATATIDGSALVRTLDFTQTVTVAATVDTAINGVTGSLRKEITDNIAAAVSGKDPNTTKPLFSTANHATGTYVYNTACWAYGWASMITCFSPWNSRGAQQRAGVAVTAINTVHATHFPLAVNDVIRFVALDGTVVDRTVIGLQEVLNPAGTDSIVTVLDSPLPGSIYICKVLPTTWENYFTLGTSGYGLGEALPMLTMDQENKATVVRVGVFISGGPGMENELIYGYPVVDAEQATFYEGLIPGDSGSPQFVKIGADLVLMSTATSVISGASYPYLRTALQTAINTANAAAGVGSYTLTDVDLSGYTDFS